MKKKLISTLKTLLNDKGLTSEEIESLADIAVQNLKDDSTDEDINNAASGVLPYAVIMQKVANRYVSKVKKEYEAKLPKPEPQADQTPKDEPNGGGAEPPKSAPKALSAEEIAKLVSEKVGEALKPYKEREEQTRLRTLLDSNEKLKGIPQTFVKRYSLAKDEELDSTIQTIENDYAQFKSELLRDGVFVEPPKGGNNEATDVDAQINVLKAALGN